MRCRTSPSTSMTRPGKAPSTPASPKSASASALVAMSSTSRPAGVSALHSYFTRRANRQQLDQKAYIRQETLARLNPAARFILDG